jgi:hypothetical protein
LGMPNSDIRIALIQLILNDVKNDGLESQHQYIPWQPIISVDIPTKIRSRFLREDSWRHLRVREAEWELATDVGKCHGVACNPSGDPEKSPRTVEMASEEVKREEDEMVSEEVKR